VQNLADWSDKAWYVSADAVPGGVTNDVYKTQKLLMRRIPAAEVVWTMGSPTGEAGRGQYSEVQRRVVLSKDYYMAVYETTKRQWELVMGKRHDCKFTNAECWATRPADNVSYTELRGSNHGWPNSMQVGDGSFVGVLRSRSGCPSFDIPTEAQWEFACRAGSETSYYNGLEIYATGKFCPVLDPLARYWYNGGYLSDGKTKPDTSTCTTENGTDKVGSHVPNAWGLYDMLGNVREPGRDRFSASWTETGDLVRDPKGATTGSNCAQRGGGCYSPPEECRCAFRGSAAFTANGAATGFRLCLEL